MKSSFSLPVIFFLLGVTGLPAQTTGLAAVEPLSSGATRTRSETELDLSEADAETRAAVRAAAEDVLMRRGNPPFAAIISNDAVKSVELKARFEQVRDLQRLRQENELLTQQKAISLNEILRLQTQIGTLSVQSEEARLKLGQLRQIIDLVVVDLKKTQETIQDAPARQAPAPAAVAPAASRK
ncbi:MAG: hypothetical protein H2172_07385 [Opitutus sp.]|nr:hypothetical protein [Opitutus sp.]MCS6246595.1 hypothetical protein [Opitutus sp.]MCS6274586.1 hypothetical protein [Opitutus sp.]MCS6276065.1 hypothetical protein [Opitutus sp.]MCS6301161.1 hypothetical protein [Opitutus sp.]